MFSYTRGTKSLPKTAKVCRKYQDSIGTLYMSRPLAYKMTDHDARADLRKNSTSSCHGRRRLELPGIVEILLLTISFFIRDDRKFRRAVKETNLPGVHRSGVRRRRVTRSPSRGFAVEPAETTSDRLSRLSKRAFGRQSRSPGASAACSAEP
jgi:hypothetical protein